MISSRLFGLSLICAVTVLQGCNLSSAAYNFTAEIEQCRSMNDINTILEGKFLKPSKELSKFDDINEELDGVKKAKVIYNFKVKHLHFGNSGITDNRTGKQLAPHSIIIREGEAPKDAIGKQALICYGGSPNKIKYIHLAN